MRGAALLLVLSGCTAAVPWDPERTRAAIRIWHLRNDPEPLSHIEPWPLSNGSNLVAAICEYREDWDGFFGIYHVKDGAVDWEASPDDLPGEQSITQLRALTLRGFGGPIMEVFGKTHMGNGSLYLYELQDRRLVLLLQTKAVDFSPDPLMYRGGRLETAYRDIDGDGFLDLILDGTIEDRGEKGDTLLRSFHCRRVFLWHRSSERFIEDLAAREGFESSD